MHEHFAHERDSLLSQLKNEKEQLLREIERVQQDRDEQLMEVESNKQEVSWTYDHKWS